MDEAVAAIDYLKVLLHAKREETMSEKEADDRIGKTCEFIEWRLGISQHAEVHARKAAGSTDSAQSLREVVKADREESARKAAGK